MRSRSPALTAATADKHVLYQRAVQDPDHEVRFITRVFRRHRGRIPLSLREDFCGTALSSATWAASSALRSATGLDLDRRVLAWGHRHNIAPLGSASQRVQLLEQDVRSVSRHKFDACAAMNFSYFAFKQRGMLVSYFRDVCRSLAEDGIFFLDAYGGYEAQQVLMDRRRVGAFVYEWEQASFNPIDNSVVNHIHFRFRDGSRMFRAFTYRWRLWQLIEIREALEEAGFKTVEIYWEEEDEDGEGTGTFRRRKVAENGAGWLALIAACR